MRQPVTVVVGVLLVLVVLGAASARAQNIALGMSRSTFGDGGYGGWFTDVDVPVWGMVNAAGVVNTVAVTDWPFSRDRVYAGIGPRVRFGGETLEVFGHVMLGLLNFDNFWLAERETGFSPIYGGGVDWRLGRRGVGVRASVMRAGRTQSGLARTVSAAPATTFQFGAVWNPTGKPGSR